MNNAYAFFDPQQINAENAENIHIVVGFFDPSTKVFSHKYTCCCGKCSLIPGASFINVAAEGSVEATRMKAREIAKWFEDNGHRVCGQCVATLFSDDV